MVTAKITCLKWFLFTPKLFFGFTSQLLVEKQKKSYF
jgi:hypothetical protein